MDLLKCFFVLSTLVTCACTSQTPQDNKDLKQGIPDGPFFGIEASLTPQTLLPGVISTNKGEYNGTFNPEGTEFFYTTSILEYDVLTYTSMRDNGSWRSPEIATFSSPFHEFDPLFSPDGQRLYFSSHRPVLLNNNSDTCNIWFVERNSVGWGEPQFVPLKGPAAGNYHSSISNSGTIYFNIWNTGDLFRGIKTETGYEVENLGDIINSIQGDGDSFVSPDETYIIFRSYRSEGIGSGDLWISFNKEGEFGKPINLGEPINSKWNEMCPYVTTNGQLFIFSSGRVEESYYDIGIEKLSDVEAKLNSHDNGQQNIYVMSADFIEEMKLKYFNE